MVKLPKAAECKCDFILDQKEIDQLNSMMDLHTDFYEEIVAGIEKDGSTKNWSGKMIILAQSLMLYVSMNDITHKVQHFKYPDNEIMHAKFQKLLDIVQKQKDAGF